MKIEELLFTHFMPSNVENPFSSGCVVESAFYGITIS